MAPPIVPDDNWDTKKRPRPQEEHGITAGDMPNTRGTTSVWSATGMAKEMTPRLIQTLRFHDPTSDTRVQFTDEESRRICHKIDKRVLPVLAWLYFLLALDKVVVGHSMFLGLQSDMGLAGARFYWVVTIALIAQLTWLPPFAFLIVKVQLKILLPVMILGWGVAQACTSAAYSFGGLIAARAVFGSFEAGCLPLFVMITGAWYRRTEQPLRIAAWYGGSGLAYLVAPLLSYGFGKMQSPHIAPWRIMFLSTGSMTIMTAPFVRWKFESDVHNTSFLTEKEQAIAIERLRANQAGSDSREMKWGQAKEVFTDFKTWLFFIMSLTNSLGAQVPYTFGPLILKRLSHDTYTSLLLNMPFGALQYIAVLGVSWLVTKFRWKSLALGSSLVPVIIGLVILFVLPQETTNTAVLLITYHLFSFIFAFNSLVLSWTIANTAGQTKKSITLCLYSTASSIGSIVGPLVFKSSDAPRYESALKIILGVYIGTFWAVIIQVINLVLLNRVQEKKRVTQQKPAKIVDHSMRAKYLSLAVDNEPYIGDFAFADLTDKQNDEFVHVY